MYLNEQILINLGLYTALRLVARKPQNEIKDEIVIWLHGFAFLFCEEETIKLVLGLHCHTELSVGSASPVSLENGPEIGPGFRPGMAGELGQVSDTEGTDLC